MTLRVRLAAILGLMLVGAVMITGLVAVDRMRDALYDEVDALVLFRAGGPQDLGAAAGRPSRPLLSTGNEFNDPDGRNVAEFVVDADGEVLSEVLAGFDDVPLPAPDLDAVPSGRLDAPVTISSVDGSMQYRVMTQLVGERGDGVRIVAGSLADADETVADVRRTVVLAGLIAAALGAAIGWLIIRRETRPLTDVVAAAEGFADGDLDRRAEIVRPGSEIGRLGTGLNGALDQVERSVRAEQAANERLSAFVDDVAHELRTPATTIAGWSELYQEGALESEADVDRMVERIRGETVRLSGLVEEMVLLARHDTVRPNLLDDVDLVDVVADVVDDANALDRSRQIEVRAPESAVIRGDRTRLEQVMANVLDNARVHTPVGTPIDVSVRLAGDEVEIVVADDGPGIPADLVDKVFDRSFRAATAGARGRGLGLAIVKAVVEGHGGTIAISSDQGRGTRVTISLPRR